LQRLIPRTAPTIIYFTSQAIIPYICVFTDNSWSVEASVEAVDTSLVAAAVEEDSILAVAVVVAAVARILVAVEEVVGACTEEAEEAKTETAFSCAAPVVIESSISPPAISA
jgi:hypothetical protein